MRRTSADNTGQKNLVRPVRAGCRTQSGADRWEPPKGGFPTLVRSPSQIADALTDAAYRLRRLSPSHRNPHHYHEEKSEIEHELRKLAKEVLHG